MGKIAVPVNFEDILHEIDTMKTALAEMKDICLQQITDEKRNFSLYKRISCFEWYIEGLYYHLNNMIYFYRSMTDEVGNALWPSFQEGKINTEILFMGDEYLSKLHYELYSFINLYRIALDHFPKMLCYQFTNKHLPQSISDFKSKTTNCPILERITNNDVVAYFKSFRDYVVHYRPFIAGSHYYVCSDNAMSKIKEMPNYNDIKEHFIISNFRLASVNKPSDTLVVNFYIPDIFYYKEGTNINPIKAFTYEKKRGLLEYASKAVRFLWLSYIETLGYIKNDDTQFTYRKEKYDTPVSYTDFDLCADFIKEPTT